MTTIYGKTILFDTKDGSDTITLQAATGKDLEIKGNLTGTFSGTLSAAQNEEVIFSDNGVMSGDEGFKYNKTTSSLFVEGSVEANALNGSVSTDSLGHNEIYTGTAPTSVITTQTTNLDNLGTDVVMARSNNRVAWACPKPDDGGGSVWLETSPSVFSEYTTALLTYSTITTGTGTKFIGLNEDANILGITTGDEGDGELYTWTRSGSTWTLAGGSLLGMSACRISGTRLFSYQYNSNFRTHTWNGSSWTLEQKILTPNLGANLNLDYPIFISGTKLGLYYNGSVRIYTFSTFWALTTTIAITAISMDYYNGVLAILSSSELKIYENEVLVQTISLANADKVCTNGTYIFTSDTSDVIRIYKKVGSTWTESVNTYTLSGAGKMSANSDYLAVGAPTVGTYGTGYLFKIETYANEPIIINTIDLVDSNSRISINSSSGITTGSDLYLTSLVSRSLATNTLGKIVPSGWMSKGIFVPAGWGSNIKSALASSNSTLANIAFVGDSITLGYDSSNFYTTNYVSLVRTALQSIYGNGGTGFLGVNASVFYGSYNATNTNCTKSAGWTELWDGGGCANYAFYTVAAGNTFTFTNVIGTSVSVYYARTEFSGTFSIAVNGGTPVVVNAYDANPANRASLPYTFTGLGAGPHSVVVTSIGTTLVYGVRGFNSTGITCDNFGVSAQTSGSFLRAGATVYNNPVDASGGEDFPCNLFVYALAVNDCNNQSGAAASADAYLANVLTVIKRIREGPSYSRTGETDILFFMPHIGKWQSTGPDYYAMMSRLEALLISYNVAYINMSAIYNNSWTQAFNNSVWANPARTGNGASGNDSVHPGNVGSQAYANAIISLLNNTVSY